MANNKMDSAGLAALISNIKRLFSTKGHKHTISDLVNYKVDSELISGSTNPVQNTAIVSALSNKAESSHTHTTADVTDLQNSLDTKANSSHTHAADDITSVNASAITGTISESNLPSYVDDVLEYDSKDNFPGTGESGKIYIDTSTNLTYRWGGTAYVSINSSLALGETSSTAYAGDKGAAAYKHAVTNKGAAFSNGLYKITTNSEGHVTAATSVTKSDITALGIPAQDTTYSVGNGTITVTQNGTTKGTFTVNQSGNTTIALTDTNTDTNTHYTSKNVVGSSTATSNTTTALTNGNVYFNSVENGAVTSTHNIKGSGGTTVVSDANGNIVIDSAVATSDLSHEEVAEFVDETNVINAEAINGLEAFVSNIHTNLLTVATTSDNGLMSSADKTKLDNLPSITASTTEPTASDGKDGDIWIVYEA